MAVQRIFDNPFYTYFRNHLCPKCGSILDVIKVKRVVNSKSPEAKNFDFSSGETFMIGDVKFIWNEFLCPKCNFQISVKEKRKLDKELKKSTSIGK